MTSTELLLEIRKIVREELQIALSSKKSVSENVSTPLRKKKRIVAPVKNQEAINEKLKAIKHLQKKFNVTEGFEEEDDNDEETASKSVVNSLKHGTSQQQHMHDVLHKDYSAVLKKTGDIK